MSMLTSPTATVANPRSGTLRNLPTAVAFLLAVVGAVLVGALGTTVIAAVAHGVGVSHSFTPLHPGIYLAFIVLGVLGGAAGWQLVRAKAHQPANFLRTLVPVVAILSFIPDIAIGITGTFHATWGGVIPLMAAHVVVATAAVTVSPRFCRSMVRAPTEVGGRLRTRPQSGKRRLRADTELLSSHG